MIIPASQNDYATGFADGYRQGKKDAERKKGRWINHGQYADFFPHCEYRCSVCDHPYLEIEIAYNFCPNCGADMRGGDDATAI